MFRGLRLRLTLLYALAALGLIALVGAGTYLILDRYFSSSVDLALQHKMATEFQARSVALPAELAQADREWHAARAETPVPVSVDRAVPTATPVARSSAAGSGGEGEGSSEGEGESGEHEESGAASGSQETHEAGDDEAKEGEAYDAELAPIFVRPVDAQGQLITGQLAGTSPLSADQGAVSAALANGSDWRTLDTGSGRVRLLTYRLPSGSGPAAAIQVGRTIGDRDRVLNRLVLSLLVLGAGSAVLLAAGSWWLAGRSLRPAQEAWERQQAFVANASHELRTPLTLLRASTEVAMRKLPPGGESRALLGDVLGEADHMSRLVEDLLLLSRIDAGRLSLERKTVQLGEMVADVERQVGRLAAERGVRLEARGSAEQVLADPTRLRQVLLILLDNALKYTSTGGTIVMETEREGRTVKLAVADTGEGIPPEHLSHIFERFYRADEAHTSQTGGGAGLGLSIAKGLVEAQGGRISAESQIGRGTRFTIRLPAPAT